MPHLSRNKLSRKTEQEITEKLVLILTTTTRTKEMTELLNSLITPTEKIMLAKRLAIIVLLEDGTPEAQVAQILHVTRSTVAKMQLFYEARGKGFKIALKKLEEQKQLESFKKLLISLARYSARAAGGHVKPSILD